MILLIDSLLEGYVLAGKEGDWFPGLVVELFESYRYFFELDLFLGPTFSLLHDLSFEEIFESFLFFLRKLCLLIGIWIRPIYINLDADFFYSSNKIFLDNLINFQIIFFLAPKVSQVIL